MRILSIHIQNFGKFQDLHLEFSEHLNLIYGYNEAGKSTLHSFIRAMLYGMERARGRASKTDSWSKFEPWNSYGNYGGSMRISFENVIYRIERNFARQAKNPLVLIDESNAREVPSAQAFISNKILNSMSMLSYNNTVSIGQLKSSTDAAMVSELRNYIANINTSGNLSINISKAIELLKDERKQFTSKLVPEASKAYASNLSSIKSIEDRLNVPAQSNEAESLSLSMQDMERQQSKLLKEKERLIATLSAAGQQLEDSGITSLEDIDSQELYIKERIDELSEIKQNSKLNVYKWASSLSLLVSIVCALFIAFMYIFNKNESLSTSMSSSRHISIIALIAAFIIALIASHIFIRAYNSEKDIYEEKLHELKSMLGKNVDLESASYKAKFSKLRDLFLSLKENESLLDRINQELAVFELKSKNIMQSIDSSNRNLWEQEKYLEELVSLSDENEALKAIIEENERLQFEIDAIDLSIETIESLSSTIKDSFGHYLNKEASELISGITGGIYTSMSIDENLGIYMNTPDKLVPIEQLSSGTMDQIYLAVRLASASLMQALEKLPLFLDDSFVNYDDKRLESVLGWLYNNYTSQILLFSCHSREEMLLDRMGATYNKIQM